MSDDGTSPRTSGPGAETGSPGASEPLQIRVLRLRPPAIEADAHSRFDVLKDLQDRGELETHGISLPCTAATPLDGQPGEPDVAGVALRLPMQFGEVYLGQNFDACIVLCNTSTSQHLINVRPTVDIEVGSRRALLSSPRAGLTLDPGAHHALMVNCTIKEPDAHVLSVHARYTLPNGADGSARASFRFNAVNPLVVKTKQRAANGCILLETVLENVAGTVFCLTRHAFLPEPPFSAEEVAPPVPPGRLGPLRTSQATRPLLDPRGGQCGLVFRLTPGSALPQSRGSMPDSWDHVPLGRLDLEWAGCNGEMGRMRTAVITAPAALVTGAAPPAGELSLSLCPLPDRLVQQQPFTLTLRAHNGAARRTTPPLLARWSGSATQGGVVGTGPAAAALPALAPGAEAVASLQMLPLAAGTQLLQGITLVDERSGATLASLPAREVYIHTA